jgi:hypothetical protein
MTRVQKNRMMTMYSLEELINDLHPPAPRAAQRRALQGKKPPTFHLSFLHVLIRLFTLIIVMDSSQFPPLVDISCPSYTRMNPWTGRMEMMLLSVFSVYQSTIIYCGRASNGCCTVLLSLITTIPSRLGHETGGLGRHKTSA